MKEERLLEKQQAVADVADKMKRAQCMVIVDYRGLTVDEATKLRSEFRNAGVEYRVIKNNMLQRAAEAADIADVASLFVGPTAVAFGYEDPVAPAKIMVKFRKDTDKTEIKGGVLSGHAIDEKGILDLSRLPGKEELLAKMLGSLNAPVTKFALALSAVPKGLAIALNGVVEKKQADPNFTGVDAPSADVQAAVPSDETSAQGDPQDVSQADEAPKAEESADSEETAAE